ncbi:probable ATP-dependent RNA helicase DDX43 [Pieris rapae]|uniref:probable ATP-dependent RNA helicase DDX43 n=1 Tax=Pieris rapae TaxID=64459 RepID=UPI001E281653|nr:probable ATP-dependent RNA helicase DDX43 [Pieris rapae]XP_022129519.2 probable ATP-dependent RNA helicase DDX43 [Pieris rapae]
MEFNNFNIPKIVASVGQRAPPERSCQSTANYSSNGQREGPRSNHSHAALILNEPCVDKVMSIPSAKVGQVIGSGGAKVRDLQHSFNVRIKIGKSAVDTTDIILFGTDSAITKVEEMIKELIDEKWSSTKPEVSSSSGTSAQAGSCPNKYVHGKGKETIPKVLTQCNQAQNTNTVNLPNIVKNFYKEDPVISLMPRDMITYWRNIYDIDVKLRGKHDKVKEIPNLLFTFEQAFKDYPEILEKLYKQGLTKPFPIQSQVWPILLKGEDMIATAQTNVGKTLAFLLPALVHVLGQPTPRIERAGPSALFVAPTKQLAIQIQKELKKYVYNGITSMCYIHVADLYEDFYFILKGVDIIITTPRRLADLIIVKQINVRCISYIVLDEVDQMLDMGFGPQINLSLIELGSEHQFVMTSATLSPAVRHLADTYMNNPIYVNVGSIHTIKAGYTITQKVKVVDENDKFTLLNQFMYNLDSNKKVLIICATKTIAYNVAEDLFDNGFECDSFVDQSEIEEGFDDTSNILIATNVADIVLKDITHFVNFDFPEKIEDYVKRIIQIESAGGKGVVISIMTQNDSANASALIDILNKGKQEVPSELQNMVEVYNKSKKEIKRGRHGQKGRKQ